MIDINASRDHQMLVDFSDPDKVVLRIFVSTGSAWRRLVASVRYILGLDVEGPGFFPVELSADNVRRLRAAIDAWEMSRDLEIEAEEVVF